MWLCLVLNTPEGACRVVDVFENPPVTSTKHLLSLPVVQECGVVAFSATSIHTELKHKRVSMCVEKLPSTKWTDKPDCDAPLITLKAPSLLTKYAVMSHWFELQLRKPGKLLSTKKAQKIINKAKPDTTLDVTPRFVQWVRLVFRDPLPPNVDAQLVMKHINRRQQPQEQLTAKNVIEVLECMAAKHKRVQVMFSYACFWVRKKLPDSYLLACLPTYNSVWNFLAVALNHGM